MVEAEDLIEGGLGALGDDETRPSDDDELEIRQWDDVDSRRFGLLVREYQRSIDIQTRQMDQVLRVAGIGFAASGALFFLFVEGTLSIGEWVYWVVPLMLAMLYTLVIALLYGILFLGYYTREIEDDLAKYADIPYFHFTNTMSRGLSSIRTGYPPYLAAGGLLIVFGTAIYFAMLTLGIGKMRSADTPLFRQSVYLLLHGSISLVLIWSSIGIWSNLRPQYEKWRTTPASGSRERAAILTAQRAHVFDVIRYAILPRPFDFLAKIPYTIGALAVTAVIVGDAPLSTLITYGFWVVICVDFLAKQATYIWNEILDAPTDKGHPYKNERLLARYGLIRAGKLLFLTRALAALVLAFVLADEFNLWWLPIIVVVTFVWQFAYDRWAKRRPARRVVFASLGYIERVAAGALAAMAAAGTYDYLLVSLLSGWIIFCTIAQLAEFWWAERHHQWTMVSSAEPEGRNAESADDIQPEKTIWFLRRAPHVEKAANLLLVAAGAGIAIIYAGGNSSRIDRVKSSLGDLRDWAERSPGSFLSRTLDRAFDHRQSDLASLNISDEKLLRFSILPIVVGALLVILVRVFVTPEKRGAWLMGIGAVMILGVVLVPPDLWLFVVAAGAPVLLAANIEKLSLGELEAMNRLVREAPKKAIAVVDHVLFQPWAVRLSIRPLAPEASTQDEIRLADQWAGQLHTMYATWAAGKDGIEAHAPSGRDGGGKHDIVIHGKAWRRFPLVSETGIHEMVLTLPSARGPAKARIWAQPIGVPPHDSFGSGLDLGLPTSLTETSDIGDIPVRRYLCSDDAGSLACAEIVDGTTGKRIVAPHETRLDKMLGLWFDSRQESREASAGAERSRR